jgi:hypothetical protein
MRREFKNGPLNFYQVKTLTLFAEHFPEARALLEKCLGDSRPRKPEFTAEQQRLVLEKFRARAEAKGIVLTPAVEKRFVAWWGKSVRKGLNPKWTS